MEQLLKKRAWSPVGEIIDLKNCEVKLTCKTDAGADQSLIVRVGEGTLQWTEKVTREYKLNRGRLDTVRDGDEEPVEWSLDVAFNWIQGSTLAPVSDGIGELQAYIKGDSTHVTVDSADACAPHAFTITAEYEPGCGATGARTITLANCRHESLQFDIGAGTIALSGRANVTVATISDPIISSD